MLDYPTLNFLSEHAFKIKHTIINHTLILVAYSFMDELKPDSKRSVKFKDTDSVDKLPIKRKPNF